MQVAGENVRQAAEEKIFERKLKSSMYEELRRGHFRQNGYQENVPQSWNNQSAAGTPV